MISSISAAVNPSAFRELELCRMHTPECLRFFRLSARTEPNLCNLPYRTFLLMNKTSHPTLNVPPSLAHLDLSHVLRDSRPPILEQLAVVTVNKPFVLKVLTAFCEP
jgi:hypothetical protein